jgi:hypothetical protein
MSTDSQNKKGFFSYTSFHTVFSNLYLGLALIAMLGIALFQPMHLLYWQEGTTWPFFWSFTFLALSLLLHVGAYFLAVGKNQRELNDQYIVSFYVLIGFHIFSLSLAWGILFSWMIGIATSFFLTWLYASHFDKGGIASLVESIVWRIGAREVAEELRGWKSEQIQDNIFGSLLYSWGVMTILLAILFFRVLYVL